MDEDFRAAERVLAVFCRGASALLAVCAALFGAAWLLSGIGSDQIGWLTVSTVVGAALLRGAAWLWQPSE